MVGAPGDAKADDAVTITLTAEVGPPTSRINTYTNASLLKVGTSGGGAVLGQVVITQHRITPLSVDPSNIAPNAIFDLQVSVTYSSTDATAQDFNLRLSVTAGDATVWTFSDDDTGTPLPQSQAGGVYTLRLAGVSADGSPRVGRVRIQAPARSSTADRSVTLGLSIVSVNLSPPLEDDYGTPISLVVKQGP